MLYVLPPPKNSSLPSPWDSILYGDNVATATGGREISDGKRFAKIAKINKHKSKDGINGQNDMDQVRSSKSLSECYFAGKGAALVLPDAEAASASPQQRTVAGGGQRPSVTGTNIQKHLQSMFYLLRPEETLKMAVKLESIHPGRTRYLVVVSRMGNRGEESCLLGIDCNERTTVGLVLRVLADTSIRLDGDGGFSVSVCGRHHIFKPVSVQAMWSALQTLHKVSSKAREQNYFQAGLSHAWVAYYEDRIESDRSCLNEWHAMDNLESKRPPSPDSVRTKPTEREETERVIRTTLKEIMMSVDLDEVTSKYIRTRLEEELDVDLGEYKSFIDQEMLTILGQMDAPTEIFDHVYLGSEWNASNYDELRKNGVGHILNVTKEIDNFFPGTFDYLNIRVYDDEKTDLLKHWDDTFKYITRARNQGSKVLVHCKMGVSRSASVVIAYAMKAYNWDFKTAWKHVKEKRNCIKPNTAFISQLETYRGILDAMKNKEKLQRSKSETNLKKKSADAVDKGDKVRSSAGRQQEMSVSSLALRKCTIENGVSGRDLKRSGLRPKSWSPECARVVESTSPVFLSLEDLSQKSSSRESIQHDQHQLQQQQQQQHHHHQQQQQLNNRKSFLPRHMLMPCDNGESYSVSPNRIVHLPADGGAGLTVRDLITELESKASSVESSDDNMCDKCCWTASAVVKTVETNDPFSKILDKVFDKEEKKQHHHQRECPSRQNSWSSYDSAVVMGNGQTELSRHSSWGSGDTRTLPSRNSSWGSYDIKPKTATTSEEEECNSGTVRRTRLKLEPTDNANEPTTKCIEIPVIETKRKDSHCRLSLSAPEPSSINLVPKECSLSRCASNGSTISAARKLEKATVVANGSGMVQNLKREFEAKTATNDTHDVTNLDSSRNKSTNKNNSMPSSPTGLPAEKPKQPEDLSLKNLIGIFENNKRREKTAEQNGQKVTHDKNVTRYSCIEVPTSFCLKRAESEFKRPPVSPVVRKVVAATVIATAAKKQQQFGKSHPLARLNIKPRHNNPVYNTM